MKRWHLGCLLLGLLGLFGCDEVPPPDCYLPSLSLANPAELPGFDIWEEGSILYIKNAGAPKTTFVLRPDIYSAPWAGKFVLSNHSTLPIRADAVMPLQVVPKPYYPACDQPPAESSVPLTVIQDGQSREVALRITYVYNKWGIQGYAGVAEAKADREQMTKLLLGAGIVILTIVGIGAVYLIITLISALATLASKE
jgi:hypothetical protein